MPRFPSNVFPSHARLLELCHYDPVTGIFTWKKGFHKSRIGKTMGYVSKWGYLRITIEGVRYSAGPLAWFYVTGTWPTKDIDHIDRDRLNNRFLNFREATVNQNQINSNRYKNMTGYRGVSRSKEGRFRANIKICGKLKYLGTYDVAEKAALRYDQGAKEYHGQFAAFNFPDSVHRDWLLI